MKITIRRVLAVMIAAGSAMAAGAASAEEELTPEQIAKLQRTAEQGNAEAQFSLGFVYDYGLGVPEDDIEAVRWYRLSAEQGDAEAQAFLGYMYETGEGVPQNYAEAVRWYRKAAFQGKDQAQAGLGRLYASGKGIPEDLIEAYAWASVATAQNAEHAGLRDSIAWKMQHGFRRFSNPEGMDKAQMRAAEIWQRIHAQATLETAP